MKKIIFIFFIGLILYGCISIDPLSNELSKTQQPFIEGKSYIFSIIPSYNSKKDTLLVKDLGRYFYLYDKGGQYIRITPKFSSQELRAEILNGNKQVINGHDLKLLPYSKENLDQNRESRILYFNNRYEILSKTNYNVADLSQSWGSYTDLTFLDKNGNLIISKKHTELALIFLIPTGSKSVFISIFNKVE